jgi:hypothetical protein
MLSHFFEKGAGWRGSATLNNNQNIIMRDLQIYLTNPFDDQRISMDALVRFSTDHLARLIANNPAAVFAPRITATTAALNGVGGAFSDDKTKAALRKARIQAKDNFRLALPAAIGKIYGEVLAKFADASPEMTECFPRGRSVFSQCTDGALAEELQALLNGVTAHAAALGAQAVTDATALGTGWTAVYQTSETSTGNKSGSQAAKQAARSALQLELFKNLLTLALNFPGQPEQLDTYMQQSLLEPHTASSSTPPPAPTPAPAPAAGK